MAQRRSNDNILVKILNDNWEKFKIFDPSYADEYYDEVIEKVRNCGDPSFGYIEYGCMNCGGGKHRVAFTCKSFLCLRCGRVRSEEFVNEVMGKLISGVVYRHLTLTIPDELIPFFYERRKCKELYNELYKIGFNYIQDVFEEVTGRRLKCGAVIVMHTVGRKCNYRPHLHIIVMNGGIDLVTGAWINIGYFPYEDLLPKKWQWHLLNMIKNFDQSKSTKELVDFLWKNKPNGFYNRFEKGDVPQRSKYLVQYLAKYLFRPMISIKRIHRYDPAKNLVVYEYKDHQTKKTEIERVSVFEFIKRLVCQILPKGFHKVKYYGLHHPRTHEKSKRLVNAGMAKQLRNKKLFKEERTLFIAKKDTYQERMIGWTGSDPLQCPCCGHQMEIIKVWSKHSGVIFDLIDEYRKQCRPPPRVLKKIRDNVPSEPIDIIRDSGGIQMELCFVS